MKTIKINNGRESEFFKDCGCNASAVNGGSAIAVNYCSWEHHEQGNFFDGSEIEIVGEAAYRAAVADEIKGRS